MSGRVRVDLPDGRRVTGYRKTLRRNPRRPLHERLHGFNELYRRKFPQGWRPDVRMGFLLPKSLAAFVSEGPHGHGVHAHRAGFVQVCNGSAAECFISASHFFEAIAKGRPPFTVLAVISSSSHPDRKYCRYLTVVNGVLVESSGQVEPHVWGAWAA